MRLEASPIHADLGLQKVLYFNFYYSFVFGVAQIASCAYKLAYLAVSPTTTYVLPVLIALWTICEIGRLRLGYVGNLREKVPELSAFWLLSIFPQLPFVLFLSFGQIALGDFLPLDHAAGVLLTLFLVLELHFSRRAVGVFIRKQTADFYRLCQEDSLSAAAVAEAARLTQPAIIAHRVIEAQQQQQPLLQRSGDGGLAAAGAAAGVGVGALAQQGVAFLRDTTTGGGGPRVGGVGGLPPLASRRTVGGGAGAALHAHRE